MSTPAPPGGDAGRPRRAHRAEPQSRSLLLPLVGVLAVLAALVLAGYMVLTSDEDPSANIVPGPTGPRSSASSSPSDKAPASPTASKSPTKQPTKQPTKEPTKEPTKKPTKQPSVDPIPSVPVYVFNQTTISGLANQVASRLLDQGWHVVNVGNWRGTVPEDTVYYYPGDQAAAQQLSELMPEIDRVWPASDPMPRGALSVILATTNR